ncbi:MAG: hypothetical protein H7Z12_19985, partial [Rhodospirillaceae bacterium]|nr:hypothetical protein [Rhodospirillales bacterium]
MTKIRMFAAAALVLATATPAFAKEAPITFSEDVQPIIQQRCAMCHQAGAEGFVKSGFDLTSYVGMLKGTKHGALFSPGDPVSSNLMVLIDGKADKSLQMPHGKK